MDDIRIVFMGTPGFAVGVLKKLIEEGQNVVGVITAPDKPAGRGRKLHESAVKKYALEQEIPLLQPTNLKNEAFLTDLASLNANLQIVVAFRMLPKAVWAMPRFGTFNLHASLLPQYRGAAPINWAIVNGETQTGVTTFFIDEKIDTGAILLQETVPIATTETVGTLHDKLMEVGSELVLQTVTWIANGKATAQPQVPQNDLKEAPKLTSENTQIDWSKGIETIDALIRGLSPYPAAWSYLTNNKEKLKVKIYACEIQEETHSHTPGSLHVGKKELKIAASNGYVSIQQLQIPGKRKMDVVSLLNGYSFDEGAKML